MSISAMFSYNQHSEGSKELAKAMNVPRIKHHGSTFKANSQKTILNWGASVEKFPEALLGAGTIINHPTRVDLAADKIKTFRAFAAAGVRCPEFTTDLSVATAWLEEGDMVFARTQLRAHSGRGIVQMDPDHGDTWNVSAPLYVRYIKKQDEYRIHVCRGQVIDTQRKGLKEEFKGQPDVNFKVRNLANGFVYVRNDGRVVPQCVLDVGIAAVNSLGLDFGAADVIHNTKQGANGAYALEVNTAPGLTGTTVTNYANALRVL